MKLLKAAAFLLLACASLGAGAVGRMADVSVFDRSTGRELPVYWHQGRPFVVGQPGNEYKVVVRNRLREDLLAVVSVDGVNVLSGRTASPEQPGYIVNARDRLDVVGWRKSMDETASFYFTSLGDSYAGRTGRPDDAGVIGVALFERASYREPPVAVEPENPWRRKQEAGAPPEAKSKSHAPGTPLGTGHGRRESSEARYADFERATPEPAEMIAIYYDSYRNLVAQGVIPPRYGRRQPDPFPGGFVPDPPRYR